MDMKVFSQVETQRLYQQVAGQVMELLNEGRWEVGDRLPAEREIAAQLGVSRPVVREAMIALEILGLVQVKIGSGIYVKSLVTDATPVLASGEDPGPSPFDLIQSRRIIEGETAAIAAENSSPAILESLAASIKKMEGDAKLGKQNLTHREDGDWFFHSQIAAATGNAVMQSIVEQLWEGMRRPIFTAICVRVSLPENALRAVQDHKIILQAIGDKNPEAARKAMWAHIDQVRHFIFNGNEEGTP